MNDPRNDPIEYAPALSASEREHAGVMIKLQRERTNRRDQRQAHAAEANALERSFEVDRRRARGACGCGQCEAFRFRGLP